MSVDTDNFYVIIKVYIPISERKNFHMQEYVMGNGAIALGALAAGVNLVAGYRVVDKRKSRYGSSGSRSIQRCKSYGDYETGGTQRCRRSAYVTRLSRGKGRYGDSISR